MDQMTSHRISSKTVFYFTLKSIVLNRLIMVALVCELNLVANSPCGIAYVTAHDRSNRTYRSHVLLKKEEV